jgi:hypothetical protein
MIGTYKAQMLRIFTKTWYIKIEWLQYLIKFTMRPFQFEKHIKKMKSRRFIENLIKHPDMVEKIIHLTNN